MQNLLGQVLFVKNYKLRKKTGVEASAGLHPGSTNLNPAKASIPEQAS